MLYLPYMQGLYTRTRNFTRGISPNLCTMICDHGQSRWRLIFSFDLDFCNNVILTFDLIFHFIFVHYYICKALTVYQNTGPFVLYIETALYIADHCTEGIGVTPLILCIINTCVCSILWVLRTFTWALWYVAKCRTDQCTVCKHEGKLSLIASCAACCYNYSTI